jgi:hypothetical protein
VKGTEILITTTEPEADAGYTPIAGAVVAPKSVTIPLSTGGTSPTKVTVAADAQITQVTIRVGSSLSTDTDYSVSANGAANEADTTEITFDFDKVLKNDLDIGNINFSPNTAFTKGTLTQSTDDTSVWVLGVTLAEGVTEDTEVLFTINQSGIKSTPKPVTLHKAAAPQLNPGAAITNGVGIISGRAGTALAANTVEITLTDATFNDTVTVNGTVPTGWFTTLPTGLSAKFTAINGAKTIVTITIEGIPSAATPVTGTEVAVKVPVAALTSGPAAALSAGNITFNIVGATDPGASITSGGEKIEGRVNTPLANSRDVVITVERDTFKAIALNADLKGWFTGLPAGLAANAKGNTADAATIVTITISGTPTESADNKSVVVTVPAAALTSEPDAALIAGSITFEIVAATAPGKAGINVTPPTLDPDAVITITKTGGGTLTFASGTAISLTATVGGNPVPTVTAWEWYLDGVKDAANTTAVFAKPAGNSLSATRHTVTVVVTIGTVKYSKNVTFTVTTP